MGLQLNWMILKAFSTHQELRMRETSALQVGEISQGMQAKKHKRIGFFCCNVFIMCQKLHHSLLHASVGECSLACIYYNEVETSHTASQKPHKEQLGYATMQHQLSRRKKNLKKEGEIRTLVLWHTASDRGESKKKNKVLKSQQQHFSWLHCYSTRFGKERKSTCTL